MRLSATALILAGGQSRRMGRPKAWLEFGGRPLLSLLVERFQRDFAEVLVVAGRDVELPELPCGRVAEHPPGEGPLVALAAGLEAMREPSAFVTTCDAPFVRPELARALVEALPGFDAALPRPRGELQPLTAAYHGDCAAVARRLVEAGRREARALAEAVHVREMQDEELRALDPEGRSFLNLNRPEDYAAALREWEEALRAKG